MTGKRRRPPVRPPRRRAGAITAVTAVALLPIAVAATLAIGGSQDRLEATAGQAVAASDPVLQLCGQADAVGEALRADPDNPCGLAAQVLTEPVPDDPVVIPRDGRDAPGPTPAQIRSAVAAELAVNPPAAGRPPTPEEVTTAVAAVLAAAPPDPGRPPTASEIESAVSDFFAAMPPPAGRPPTGEEIRAAVAAELAANPPRDGQQGVGVSSVRREQTGDRCSLVFTLLDPATGETSEQAVDVPAGVCAPDAAGLDLDEPADGDGVVPDPTGSP